MRGVPNIDILGNYSFSLHFSKFRYIIRSYIDSEDLWQCTTCYTCEERCPRGVPIVDVVIALRNIAVANGKMYDAHKKTADNLVKFGHTVSINDKVKAQRAELGLPEVPPTVLANDKAKADLDAIFEATGFAKLIG